MKMTYTTKKTLEEFVTELMSAEYKNLMGRCGDDDNNKNL